MKRVTTLALAVLVLLGAFRCAKESADVIPADITATGGVTPGDDAPRVATVIPDGSAPPYPVDTTFVIVFSIPVNPATVLPPATNITITSSSAGVLSSPGDYNIAMSPSNMVATITFSYGGVNPLPAADTVDVDIGAGIQDSDGDPLQNPALYTFVTGIAPDVIAPVRILASRTPAPGAVNVPLAAPVISININEANGIAPSTVNGNTFWVETTLSGEVVPVTYSPIVGGPPIWTVAMTPMVNLEPGTQYTVTLTTGVEDLSGNNLPAGTTWNFTTTATPIDPVPLAPTITDGGPLVDGVTATTAEVHWTTNETTRYTRLRYGRGDTVPAFIADPTYLSFHGVTLNPPLVAGKRYWLQFQPGDFRDWAGNVNGIAYPAIIPLQFNTETAEVPVTVHAGAMRQSAISLIQQRIGVANTGIFSFWQESDIPATRTHVYGQLYDSTPAAQWNAGSPNALYTTPATFFTYGSAVEDELGGVIVLATAGGNVYAKRLDVAGSFVNWGATADQATDLGFSIAPGSSPSAVPVYTNILLHVDSGTETRGSEALPNRVYEHDLFGLNTLFDLVADGDVIVDTANHTGTTIDVNSVAPDFGYIVGQDGVQAVAPGEAYVVGDGVTDWTSFTARDHDMNVLPDYANGGNLVYTSHGFTIPPWLVAANGDIIAGGGRYARITAISPINVASIDSGTQSSDLAGHLIDMTATWIAASVSIGDLAKNTATDIYSSITAVTDTDLTLSNDVFTSGNETYDIYDNTTTPMPSIISGTADTDVLNSLKDAGTDFSLAGVQVGDIAQNTDSGLYADVIAIPFADELTLSADIFPAGTENYTVWDNTAPAMALLDSGSASPFLTNHLVDVTATWLVAPIVQVGDLVINTTVPANRDTVTSVVSNTDLQFGSNIFPGTSDNYAIYRNFCTTHVDVQTFYQLTVDDAAFNAADGTACTIYNYLNISGTADTPPANPLYDDAANFSGIPLLIGDIVINFTNLAGFIRIATVNTGVYAVHARAADLSANVLADGDDFEIVRILGSTGTGDVVRWGTATGGGINTLVDIGTNFTALPAAAVGDIVYNLADDEYAMVTAVAANVLTLSRDATFGATDRYMVIRKRGALYVWQTAGAQVHGKVLSIDDPSVELVAEWNISNGSSPRTLADGEGNAIVVYVDAGGNIQAVKLDAAGNNLWGIPTEIDTVFLNGESIIKVLSDQSGGLVVLYKQANNLYVQRINSAGNRQWGANGRTVENGVDITIQEDMVYEAADDDVIVAAAMLVGANWDIWARGVGTTNNWGFFFISQPADTSNQLNPRIYRDSGVTAIIVWDDNRFVSNAGYGIFGMKINAATGAKLPAWNANTVGAADQQGVAVILNRFNDGSYGNVRLMPYDNANEALIFWEDYRAGNSSDVVAFDLNSFIP